jgi:hypothetical protein
MAEKNPFAVAETLRRHGATQDEIDLLIQTTWHSSFGGKRVELNAMTSDELVGFIEGKFEQHGVRKLIPDNDTLELHARRMLERQMVLQELEKLLPCIRKRVTEAELPDDLRGLIEELLVGNPELPWDAAVTEIIGDKSK